MTIRNIVPRNNNEGQLGTENKKWNKIYTNEIFATNFTGNLTGTADKAIQDNNGNIITDIYVTKTELNNHNDNSEAHGNLIKRIFGSANATMDSVKTSVQNWCKESIASIFGIASATQTNVKNKILEYAQEQIESWLEKLGIRYNIAQNGYICLGKLFGDAIIQWGLDAPNKFVYFPMTFSSKALVYLAIEGPGASGTTQTSIGEVYIIICMPLTL